MTAVLSLGEIEALCLKAARGAGLPWGLAEEAGWAARALAAAGLPGPEALAAALAAGPGAAPVVAAGRWTGAGPLCPIATGAALADFAGLPEGAGPGGLALGPVMSPLLLLPFAGLAAARSGAPLAVDWGTGRGVAQGRALAFAGTDAAVAAVRLWPADAAPAAPPPVTGRAVDATARTRLEALALATTVPPSATSRGGAGAAGDDND